MAKSSEYGYLLGYRGLCRFNLPDFDHHHRSDDAPTEFEIQSVFRREEYEGFPLNMGIFISGQNVYMVGGKAEVPYYKPTRNLYVFDPTRHEEEFPVKDLTFLNKPMLLEFKPLVLPIVIQPNNHRLIYFLTQYWSPWNGNLNFQLIRFQSFDPTNNTFNTLPSPPYQHDRSLDSFREVACFVAGHYIYLFIQDHLPSYVTYHSDCKFTQAFSFNTLSSSAQWTKLPRMLHTFLGQAIPLPFFHRGHAGLSPVVDYKTKTRIMVATCDSTPIAYCVTFGANGSLRPTSYRYLLESYNLIRKDCCKSQLHDIGSGRFLVFFQCESIPLMLYVFQIDYKLEYQIQSFTNPPEITESSVLLCSTQFFDDIPSFGSPSFYTYCFASATASQSSGNKTAEAEEQDRDGKVDKRIEVYPPKRKRNRSATTSQSSDTKTAEAEEQDRDGKLDKRIEVKERGTVNLAREFQCPMDRPEK